VHARLPVRRVLAGDQDTALALSTNWLGSIPKNDVPLGQHCWPTVAELDGTHGVELFLGSDEPPAAKFSKDGLVTDGIPSTSFAVGDVGAVHRELEPHGVRYIPPRSTMGDMVTAILDDTCGNLIQLISPA
jgi:hypothetical protein